MFMFMCFKWFKKMILWEEFLIKKNFDKVIVCEWKLGL